MLWVDTEVYIYSISLTANNWVTIYLNTENQKYFQSLQTGSWWTCMLEHTFNTQLGSLKLYHLFSSCTELQVQPEAWDTRVFQRLSWGCAHHCTWIWSSKFPRMCHSFSVPLQMSHSSTFSFKFFGWFIVCLSCYISLQAGRSMVKTCL